MTSVETGRFNYWNVVVYFDLKNIIKGTTLTCVGLNNFGNRKLVFMDKLTNYATRKLLY